VVVLLVVAVLPLLPVDWLVNEVLVVEEVVLDVLEDILVEETVTTSWSLAIKNLLIVWEDV
jgi:hypothetical protein